MKQNIKLYFYGLWANFLSFIGYLIGFSSLFIFIFSKWYFGLMVLILGVGLFLYGRALRFNYKRKSGYIIHKGD